MAPPLLDTVTKVLSEVFPKLDPMARGATKFRLLIAQALEREIAKAVQEDRDMVLKFLKAEALKQSRTAVGILEAIKIIQKL